MWGFGRGNGTQRDRNPEVLLLESFNDRRLLFAKAVSFLMLCLPAAVFAVCVPPPDLQARLQKRANAENYGALGNWYADHRDFACAAQAFASASAIEPNSESFAYLWGLSLSSAGKDSAALAPLRRAETIDGSDVRPHLALGSALDHLGRIGEAEAQWRSALAIDADSSAALDALSNDLLEQKDYASAIALLDHPARSGARSPLQDLNLGIAFAGTARLEDANRVLREGLNTAPDSLPIANELAIVLLLMGNDHEAYSVFELALQKHPDDQRTEVLYLRTLVTSHGEKATQFAQQLLVKYPGNWEVLYLNGVLRSRDADFGAARSLFERSIALHPRYAPAHSALGNTLAHLNDRQAARRELERGIALGDESPDNEYALAQILRGLGDGAAAANHLQTYQRLKNDQSGKAQAAGKAESGDQLLAAGKAAEAAAQYRDALTSDPDEAVLHYKLSRALDKMNQTGDETAELERAIALDSKLVEAQNQLGYLAAREGDEDRAERFFRAAVVASPSYAVAWVNLAATLASESKWQQAADAVNHALVIDPENNQARQLRQAIASAHPVQ
jgi:tetratricopeptide (TPR) repeat protein